MIFLYSFIGSKSKKDSSVDSDYSPFARRFSRDSTKSDHEGIKQWALLQYMYMYFPFLTCFMSQSSNLKCVNYMYITLYPRFIVKVKS